jgi:hypothetical protein
MAIYFKFTSWNQATYDTVQLDGSSVVSVSELKSLILKKKKMDKNTMMVITNSQTGEGNFGVCQSILEYSDTSLVPKNASVVVRVVPGANQGPAQSQRMPQLPGLTTLRGAAPYVQLSSSFLQGLHL